MSRIEWLHRPGTKPEAWNPVTGCAKVSEGCRHCYAETMAQRFWGEQMVEIDGAQCRPRQFTDVVCHEDRLDAPLRWRTPRTVFVNSMSDLFHPAVPDAFIDRVFAVMALCPQHTFIILTKRPERMRDYMATPLRGSTSIPIAIGEFRERFKVPANWTWPHSNVWLGVSVEDQRTADERIPLLLQTPAAVRFVSAEPLLGPVDLDGDATSGPGWLRGWYCEPELDHDEVVPVQVQNDALNWVIVGGESGPKARPCDVEWIRSIVRQCQDTSVPAFVKQLGARVRVSGDAQEALGTALGLLRMRRMRDCDGDWRAMTRNTKGADTSEWPEDLRVREWPEGGAR